MSALPYLISRKIKNRFLEIIHKPSLLILTIVFVAAIAFTVFSGEVSGSHGNYRSIEEFYALIMLVYTFVFVMVSKNGFNNGASIFSMADVNLIFVSPFKSTGVLFYGLAGQLSRSLTLGVFILYQSTLAKTVYGVDFVQLVVVLAGYGITVFLGQMAAMLIYSFTSSEDKKCRNVKILYYCFVGAFVLWLFYRAYCLGGITLENLVTASRDKIFSFFPVSPATTLAVRGIISENYILLFYAAAYCLLFSLAFYLLVYFGGKDYYEDVLQSAEVTYSAITSRKEGKVQEDAPRNVKVGKTGIGKGVGASAFYYKHKKENKRGKVFILSPMSLAFVGICVLYCFILKEETGVFAIAVYMLTIGVGNGRWARELNMPYVYLLPEKSYKKLFHILREQLPGLFLESVVCFLPVFFILGLSIFQTAAMIVARVSFGALFVGINLILQRAFGTSDKKMLVVTVYFILIVLFSLPSILVGYSLGMMLPFNTEIAYGAMAIINTIISAVIIFCCRNILENSDCNYK